MNARSTLSVCAVAAVLVVAGIAGATALGMGPASADTHTTDSKAITVSAAGTVDATANQAVIDVAVTASGNDSTAVRESLAADVQSVRDALAADGVPANTVRTTNFDIRQQRDRTANGVEYSGYRGVHDLEITTNDTSAAGELIDVAVTNGADTIDGTSFTLSDAKRDRLHNDALNTAMANARQRADTLASAGGLGVAGVHAIDSADTTAHPRAEAGGMVPQSTTATTIDSGPVTVTASVQVTYNATA
ncbi:SIMPL domain-containing protein [Halobacterium salinarum]|uniref:SIMPL domain-containing protein n=1 Tax=Halobacterium salinarum TaxID=2242 RepID=UPI001F1A9938|nr:SIMPL domain-containing protein [Halobacterium salinarum]MCF2207993.1 SIMPL domain-containing protein [Halobacterium salinarum]MCF2240738.1 SIMPL domain-containing protein [Halobacterium salinarum]